MSKLEKLKEQLADIKEQINAAEDIDNLPALECLYPVANRIKSEIRAAEQHKSIKPYKPAVRLPYVNYATGRLVWD